MKTLIFLISTCFYTAQAQLVFKEFNFGKLTKLNESKFIYISLYNNYSRNLYIRNIESSENHEEIIINPKKNYSRDGRSDLNRIINAYDTLTLGIKFKNLSYKSKQSYTAQFNLEFSFFDSTEKTKLLNKIEKIKLPISYELHRKLTINTDTVVFKQRLAIDSVMPSEISISNTSGDNLIFKNKYGKNETNITIPKNSTKIFNVEFYPISNGFIKLENIDSKDFDYWIPVKFKLKNKDGKKYLSPKIKKEVDSVVLKGKKYCDGTVKFKIFNIGEDPLLIFNCNGSCGCLVPTCPRDPIMPHTYAIISAKYDTSQVGFTTKQINISSNDPENPNIIVLFKAYIEDVAIE